jgi:hypothetical protein
MTTTTETTFDRQIILRAHPIDPDRLQAMRVQGHDEHGNPWMAYPALGWEPLRCCLRLADANEAIVLISYAPFTTTSPWTEAGPVYVHADRCPGYAEDGLPAAFRTGPRVLRGYDRDRALLYDHVRVVGEGEDLAAVASELLADAVVQTVHVRALATQCFTYAITRR